MYKELSDEASFYLVREKYQTYKKLFNRIIPVLLFIQK
jgi:hypothetical protein